MELSMTAFQDLRQQIHQLCGLVLADDKAYLIEQRLAPLARSVGCGSFEELAVRLRSADSPWLRDQLVEAITTAETSFFRDGHPFEAFRNLMLPALCQADRYTPVRVWSTACSTGQEPYSLAMAVLDYLAASPAGRRTEGDFSVLGTDISARVLA